MTEKAPIRRVVRIVHVPPGLKSSPSEIQKEVGGMNFRASRRVDTSPWSSKELQRGARIRS